MKITGAEAYLAQDLVTALRATLRYCPVLATEPEGWLAAIVDFTFNLGAGKFCRDSSSAGRPKPTHCSALLRMSHFWTGYRLDPCLSLAESSLQWVLPRHF